jgi:hypothetical protein
METPLPKKKDAGRHYCRNTKHCGAKLPQVAELDSRAFCCRTCHDIFYRTRCLVCEAELPPGSANRRLCKRAKCRGAYRTFPHLYAWPESARKGTGSIIGERPPRSASAASNKHCLIPDVPAILTAPSRIKGWQWRRLPSFDDDWELFNRKGEMVARVRQAGDAYWLARPKMRPEPPLESLADAKVRGEHIALAKLDWPESERHPVHPGMTSSQYQATRRDLARRYPEWTPEQVDQFIAQTLKPGSKTGTIFTRDTPPLNVIGGYKFPGAPVVNLTAESAPEVVTSPVASVDNVIAFPFYREGVDYNEIPDFLRREISPIRKAA